MIKQSFYNKNDFHIRKIIHHNHSIKYISLFFTRKIIESK